MAQGGDQVFAGFGVWALRLRIGNPLPQPKGKQASDGSDEKGNAPSPTGHGLGRQVLVDQGGGQGPQDEPKQGAGSGQTAGQPPALDWSCLDHVGDRPGVFPAHGESLGHATTQEPIGGQRPPFGIGGQEANGQAR